MVQNKKKAVFAPKPRKLKSDAEKKFGKKADMTEFLWVKDSPRLQVTADGNCFFRAMGDDQLEGNGEEHMKYRAMVAQYIVKHREEFEPFIEDELPFHKYCDSMLKDGTWAGHMESQAASLLTRRNICIHMLNPPRWYINNFSGHEATNMIHFEHYNRVRLREDPCQGPAMPVVIKTDANIASTSNNAQTKAKDLKKPSHRSIYDHTSVKLVMAGTGCSNVAVVEHVLGELDGDVDAAIEYMITARFAVGSDDAEGDPYMDYACDEVIYFIEDELSPCQDENQMVEHKEEENCSSKDKTIQKSKSSHAKDLRRPRERPEREEAKERKNKPKQRPSRTTSL